MAEGLIPNPRKLQENIVKTRRSLYGSSKGITVNTTAAAINQARAMAQEKNFKNAIDTLAAALSIATQKNQAALCFELGKYQLEYYLENQLSEFLNGSRANFKISYDAGQRDRNLFTLWYEADSIAKDYSSAIEVSSLALQNKVNQLEWLRKRASKYLQLSRQMANALNFELTVDYKKKAARDITAAIKQSSDIEKLPLIQLHQDNNDELWNLFIRKSISALSDQVDRFELARFFISNGDKRRLNYERLFASLSGGIRHINSRGKASHDQINLIQSLTQQARSLSSNERSRSGDLENVLVGLEQQTGDLILKFRKNK
jgi:hypothetical protein